MFVCYCYNIYPAKFAPSSTSIWPLPLIVVDVSVLLELRFFLAEDSGSVTVTPPARWATLDEDDKVIAETILERQRRELSARVASKSARSNLMSSGRPDAVN